jgi:NAD(P)-dependent dehydrogenase (short-subunit alcohol dehydrogenase family)
MAGRLAGKTALITGGNSGIGLATARLFVAEGARVAITGRNRQTLDEAAASLGSSSSDSGSDSDSDSDSGDSGSGSSGSGSSGSSSGGSDRRSDGSSSVLAIQADVTELAAMTDAVARTVAAFGPIDIVFANAGIGGATPVDSTTVETFETIVRTNLTAVFFTVQAATPHLNPGASIILNGSVHAVMGVPAYSAYAAAKAGVRAMTRNLSAEFAPRRIRVNQVTPGATRTPIWSAQAPDAAAMTVLEARLSRGIPLGHLADADDIARAALYLASDDAAYVTGTEIVVDGGATGVPQGAPIYRAA